MGGVLAKVVRYLGFVFQSLKNIQDESRKVIFIDIHFDVVHFKKHMNHSANFFNARPYLRFVLANAVSNFF